MKWALLLLHFPLWTLYMGNPAAPEMTECGLVIPKDSPVGVEVGFAQNWSFDRPMKLAEEAEPDERTKLNHFSYDSQLGSVTLNIVDRVTAFASFGAMKFDLTRRPLPGNEISYKSDRDFAWSVGGQAVLFFVDWFSFGVSGSYLTTNPRVESITQNGALVGAYGARLHYSEWQVGLGGSGRFGIFVPYIGGAFASADLRVTNPEDMMPLALQVRHENFKNYDRPSVVIGLGVSDETWYFGNIEGRFVGETALTLSLSIRF